MAAQQDGLIDELLVSEVGVMWRGTMATPTPHIWDYGQVQLIKNIVAYNKILM